MKIVTRSLLACLLAVLATACGHREEAAAASTGSQQTAAQEPAPDAGPPPRVAVSGLPDFVPLVTAYGPAVVNVTTVGKVRTARDELPGVSPDDPLYDFFKRFGFGGQGGRSLPARGEG